MDLYNELHKIKNLSEETNLKITFYDETSLTGKYRGYTAAINNDPEEIAEVDIKAENGTLYALLETEITSIEVVE